MTPETIMPDGRPLFAWQNELAMYRADHSRFKADKDEVKHLMAVLNVVEIQQKRDYHTGDYLIRVHRADQIQARGSMEALEAAQITRL